MKAKEKFDKDPKKELNMLNLERLEDRIEHFEAHFKKFKRCYFQNRGFVTFRTHKVAAEVMEIYDSAILEKRKTFLNHWKKRFLGAIDNLIGHKMQQLKGKERLRAIIFNKIMKKPDPKAGGSSILVMMSSILKPSTNSIFRKKVNHMRETVGKKVHITLLKPSSLP